MKNATLAITLKGKVFNVGTLSDVGVPANNWLPLFTYFVMSGYRRSVYVSGIKHH